jgi:hypothetical protein
MKTRTLGCVEEKGGSGHRKGQLCSKRAVKVGPMDLRWGKSGGDEVEARPYCCSRGTERDEQRFKGSGGVRALEGQGGVERGA